MADAEALTIVLGTTAATKAKRSWTRSKLRRPLAKRPMGSGAEGCLERVPCRDADRGRNRARGRDVDQEGPDGDRRPRARPGDDESSESDSGRRPHRGGARVQRREVETELARLRSRAPQLP